MACVTTRLQTYRNPASSLYISSPACIKSVHSSQEAPHTHTGSSLKLPSASSKSSRRFSVHPSSLLKSSVLNRKIHFSISGTDRDSRMRLEAENLQIRRQRALRQAASVRIAAEDMAFKRQQEELRILLFVLEKGQTFSALDPDVALALARAASSSLDAEREVVRSKILECQQVLQTLQDLDDETRARASDAEFQVGTVLSAIDAEKLEVDMNPHSSYFSPMLDFSTSTSEKFTLAELAPNWTNHLEISSDRGDGSPEPPISHA